MLLRWATELAEVDASLRARLTPEKLDAIIAMIPDGWLGDVEQFTSIEAHRQAYRDYFDSRLANDGWLEEASHARSLLV